MLHLEPLEDRCLPAPWDFYFGGVLIPHTQVIALYAQNPHRADISIDVQVIDSIGTVPTGSPQTGITWTPPTLKDEVLVALVSFVGVKQPMVAGATYISSLDGVELSTGKTLPPVTDPINPQPAALTALLQFIDVPPLLPDPGSLTGFRANPLYTGPPPQWVVDAAYKAGQEIAQKGGATTTEIPNPAPAVATAPIDTAFASDVVRMLTPETRHW